MDINEITDNLCAIIMPQAEDADEALLLLKVYFKQGGYPYSAPHLQDVLDQASAMLLAAGDHKGQIHRALDLAYSSLMDC